MVQVFQPTGNTASRLGSAFGKGLSEQIPKELERYRLSQGLKSLAKNAKDLSPLEAYAETAAIPGITPAMLQALPEIIRQQRMGQGLSNLSNAQQPQGEPGFQSREKPSPFPKEPQTGTGKPSPSITSLEGIEETTKPYIPMTYEEKLALAGQLFKKQNDIYPTPEAAMQGAENIDQSKLSRSQAIQNQKLGEERVQNNVRDELAKQVQALGSHVPGNVLSDIQDRALDDVRTGKKTEIQAAKDYGKEIDEISRDYQKIEEIGDGSFFKTAKGNRDAIKNLQEKFEKRNDLRNFKDSLVANQLVSQSKASYLAYPPNRNKELSNTLVKLEDINTKTNPKTTLPEIISDEDRNLKTLNAALKIAPVNGKGSLKPGDSLLSIAEELKAKGYDPQAWMNYVGKYKDKLNLSKLQLDELSNPTDFTNSLNDIWMFSFSGLDKLVEK